MTKEEIKAYIDEQILQSGLNQKYTLEFAKVKEVKSPQKSYDAAGWDFYVPENLNITDFTKNVDIYVNDNLVRKNNVYSPAFLIKNKNDNKELWIKFYKDVATGEIKYVNMNSCKTIIPEWNKWIEDKDTVVKSIDLEFGEKILIPSGIHVKLPKNVFLKVDNKSGVASKRGLICGACIAEGALIETNKGKFSVETLTKEFCDQNEILIKTKLADGSFDYKKCDGFRCTGEVETVNVKFNDSSEVCGAIDHVIYYNNGWISLEAISNVMEKVYTGIHRVYSTNVEDTHNYVSEGDIINQNCIIDQDYEGEMHINLVNTSNNIAIINAGDKIVQMIALFQPVMKEAIEFESLEKLYENSNSARGADGFGSTDKK